MNDKKYSEGMVEDKIRLQRKYYEQIFEEMKELEERSQKRLCYLCRKAQFDEISQ